MCVYTYNVHVYVNTCMYCVCILCICTYGYICVVCISCVCTYGCVCAVCICDMGTAFDYTPSSSPTQHATHMPTTAGEMFQRSHAVCVHRRTKRKIGEVCGKCPSVQLHLTYLSIKTQLPSCVPKFDPCCNDMWAQRYRALERFVQAARKVVVRLRCERHLRLLQGTLGNNKSGDQQGE